MIPDYSKYDLAQLRQVLRTIDVERFPERVAEVRDRIAQLEQAPPDLEHAPLPQAARTALRNAGKVLLAVGAVDAIYGIANFFLHPGNGFYINFTMLLGAAMLWSCNLRAVALVRWFACVYLPIPLLWAASLGFPPLDLTLSYLRLYPLEVLVIVGLQAGHWLVALWLVRALGLPPVLAARSAAGKPVRDMRIPLALGTLGAVVSIVLMVKLLGSERAIHAESMAQQSLGKGYRVYTEGLNITKTASLRAGESATIVTASVAAWNDGVVMHVPVRWREN
ncbi:hypothetical protein Q4S45_04335 [Massilia sp. R2A-15]|uniref:hypothetical protein n=1 Tax=Massilia sp. R2A-15 TaxID=3064278 RepID=UPI002736518D|nr:hypothetical protein [Massilia sp. R2A-15]WLI90359.1 hypothetical protein Q4S45_04335 [Massilia sp. R2A-15]